MLSSRSRWLHFVFLVVWAMTRFHAMASADVVPTKAVPELWAHENLVAWCIVPFDAAKRGPAARADMLQSLGFRQFAYDWREEHVPLFDEEVETMARHGIEIVAWWFPTTLNDDARRILTVIERHHIHPQLWVAGGGSPVKNAAAQAARVSSEVTRLQPITEAAARIGCTVGLYNHNAWFGDPENQLAVLEKLQAAHVTNVRLIYNFHHGHDHIRDFAFVWPRLAPFVDTVTLNGMVLDPEKTKQTICYVGEGDYELAMMRVIQASGWHGSIAILNHRTDVDAAAGLKHNLDGLDQLAAKLRMPPAPAAASR